MFILLLLSQLVLYLFLLPGDNNLKPGSKINAKLAFHPDSVFLPSPNKIKISGRVTGSGILALQHNGTYSSTIVVNGGIYTFPDQILHLGLNRFTVRGFDQTGTAVLIDSFSLTYNAPRLFERVRSINRFPGLDKTLALTFDAGSEASETDSILNILAAKQLRATIFLTGNFIRNNPDLVARLHASEHECGNHTFSHPHLTSWVENSQHNTLSSVNIGMIQSELLKTDSVYYDLTGAGLHHLWRAPFGEYNEQILQWAAELGYIHIGWTPKCDTRDWVSDSTSSLYLSPQELFDYLLSLEQSGYLHGAIILMHLNSNRKNDHAYKMLPAFIDTMRALNYEFLPISELLQRYSTS